MNQNESREDRKSATKSDQLSLPIRLLGRTPHVVRPPFKANLWRQFRDETNNILAPMVGKVMQRVYRGELNERLLSGLDPFDPDVLQAKMQIGSKDKEALVFESEEDEVFIFLHLFECCEDVYIEDIQGDLEDLIGSPLLIAQEFTSATSEGLDDPTHKGFEVWTFYHFATQKGRVTVRWFGTSNGWYSMKVSLLYRCELLRYEKYDYLA